MRYILIAVSCMVTILSVGEAGFSHSINFDVSGFEDSGEWEGHIGTGNGNYNSTTQQLSYSSGTTSSFDNQALSLFSVGEGILSIEAMINNDGVLLSGTASWVGIHPDLGIIDETVLIAGPIIRVVFKDDPTDFFFPLQNLFVVEADIVHPSLGVLSPLWGIEVNDDPLRDFTSDFNFPGGYDFTGLRSLRVAAVPEPATAMLIISGLVGLALGKMRKRNGEV